jgi:MFS transporter, PAT family, beta-lactamase induction signal transducer AmpG
MRTREGRLAILTLLYFVQGLPYGFQATALGVYLREAHVSLTNIGLAGLLAVPWSLKALWAPFVDRHGDARFGRRKSWIVPMQALLASSMCAAAVLPPDDGLVPLLFLVLLMNLFAATMDIAVDGLAVELLSAGELGTGNAAQVVGYKLGMLTGGGVLVWASGTIGWHGLFYAMAVLVGAACAVTFFVEEPSAIPHPEAAKAKESLLSVVRALRGALSAKGAGALLLLVFTYKMGESLIDPMFQPFLRDHGFTRETIGLYVGTIGMGASILGSVCGGLLASRIAMERAMLIAATARILPLAGQASLTLFTHPPHAAVATLTGIEHFFAGMMTTTMFALMMSRTDKRIGATHYTLLATIEVLGKAPLSLASGAIADQLGYGGCFSIGVGLSVLFLTIALAPPVQRALTAR